MPPRSKVDGQAEMLLLLKKISEDNDKLHEKISKGHDKLHQEIASFRAETFGIQLKLSKRLEVMESKLRRGISESISESISEELGDIESRVEDAFSSGISDAISDGLGDLVADAISNAVSDGLGDLESSLDSSLSDTISDGLENLKSDLKESMSDEIGQQSKKVTRDIASVRRVLDASRISQDKLRCQDEFTLFPRLPPELRSRIWMMACFNNPSVVKLRVDETRDAGHRIWFSGYRLPAVLQATRESRWEAMKWYKSTYAGTILTFGTPDTEFKSIPVNPKYFNFESDILYVVIDERWDACFEGISWVEVITKLHSTRQFRRVALPHYEGRYGWRYAAKFLSKPRSKIEEIIIVVNGHILTETDQRLTSISPDCPTLDTPVPIDNFFGIPYFLESSRVTQSIKKILDNAEPDEDDGVIKVDSAADPILGLEGCLYNGGPKTSVAETDSANASTGSTEQNHVAPIPQPQKPWPKITFKALQDAYLVPNARILSA